MDTRLKLKFSIVGVIVIAASVLILRSLFEDLNESADGGATRFPANAPSGSKGLGKPASGASQKSVGEARPRNVNQEADSPNAMLSAYMAEGRKVILADGSVDPEFWAVFRFTPEQREATQKRWDRALWIASHSEGYFMTEPLTAEGTVKFTIDPSPNTGAATRRRLLEDLSAIMPEDAFQYLTSKGGLGEDDPIFGASGRNRREFVVTLSGESLQVHEKQFAYDMTEGWVLVWDSTNSFQGIPPRYAYLFEKEKP